MAQPVRGVDALNKAFGLASKQMREGLPSVLKHQAEPVRATAERNSLGIGVGPAWSQMRVGVTRREVYVAPTQRATRIAPRKRSAFDTFLKTRAMEPALESNREKVGRGIDELVARIVRQANRG